MFLLAAQLTVLEVAIFILAAFAFVIAIRFFIESKKGLEQLLTGKSASEEKSTITLFDNIKLKVGRLRRQRRMYIPPSPRVHTPAHKGFHIEFEEPSGQEEFSDVRRMIQQQQNQLTKALAQISGMEGEKVEKKPEAGMQKRVRELELALEKKDGELQKLRQQVDVSRKMQSHFDEMQKEFEVLQVKLQKLEQQAWESNELAIKLENLEQSHTHLEKDLLRKEEKLRELATENQKMRNVLNETEDKLRESNLQRQQLAKKAQFLEEMNSDMKQISETNKKLQSELRRIAELESMLNLITEERDELLKKKYR